MTEIWTYMPNWRDQVVDRLTWRTEIQNSRDGNESRRAARSAPRRVYEFTSLFQTHDRQILDARLVKFQSTEWYVPVWHDVSLLTFDVSVGNTAISFDATEREWRTGGYGVLLSDTQAEVFEVASVTSGGITIATGLTYDWPAGSAIYPAQKGLLADSVDLGQQTAGLAEARLQFRLPRQPQSPGSHSMPTYDDGGDLAPPPLWGDEPNWATPVSSIHDRLITTYDTGIGPVYRDDRADKTFFRQTRDHQFRTRSQAWELRQFLEYLQGRLRTFWVPSWTADLTATRGLDGTSPELYVEPVAWDRYGGQLGRRDLYIKTLSGAISVGINGSTAVSAGEEMLTLDATPAATALDDIKIVSWLQRARLDTDQLEFAYDTAAVGNVSVDVRSLRA